MKGRRILQTAIFLTSTGTIQAQETTGIPNDTVNAELQKIKSTVNALSNLKISGWAQIQYQWAESKGSPNYEGGNFAPNSNQRFFIRRARVKFNYKGKNSQYVMQINAVERGVNVVEVYASLFDPWTKAFSFTGGIMNRPFGFEIEQSSSVRESPERSRYTQILMPNERDLGAKISFAPVKGKPLHGLKIDAGFYNGQGIYVPGPSTPSGFPPGTLPVLGLQDFDSKKDFIGHLAYYKTSNNEKLTWGVGTSHYNGGYVYQSNVVYQDITVNNMNHPDWKPADTSATKYKGKIAPRIYYGGEAFFSFVNPLGKTTFRGEYITGTQPGQSGSTSSPFFLPSSTSTYVRKFDGFYAYFIQRILDSKHEIVIKYEWYDPNTQISGSDVRGPAANSFTAADLKFTQLGFTYNYYMNENVKFMVNYQMITNETMAASAAGVSNPYTSDLQDDVFTVRMQYKF
jgi:hypothetical protein